MEEKKQKKPSSFVIRLTACGIILCIFAICVYSGIGKKQISGIGRLISKNSDMTAVTTFAAKLFDGKPLALPLKGSVTQKYGRKHKGIDIAAEQDTPVVAAADGAVIEAGEKDGYGNCVRILHEDGYETLYGHLNTVSVNKNDVVMKGTEIGKVGSTGDSTGPHLHLEVTENGEYINPSQVVEGL